MVGVGYNTPVPTPGPDLIVVECDSYHATVRDGRVVLELRGATPTDQLPPHRNYLRPAEIASILQIGLRNLRKLMAHSENPIPFVRIGTKPRFVEEEVRKWAEAGKSPAAKRAQPVLAARPVAPGAALFGFRAPKKLAA